MTVASATTGAQERAYAIADRLRAAEWQVAITITDTDTDGSSAPTARTVKLIAQRGYQDEALTAEWTTTRGTSRSVTRRGRCRYSTLQGDRTLRTEADLATWVDRAVATRPRGTIREPFPGCNECGAAETDRHHEGCRRAE